MAPNLFGSSVGLIHQAREAVTPDAKPEKSQSSSSSFAAEKSISEEKYDAKVGKQSWLDAKASDKSKYKWRIVWRNVIAFVYLHVGAFYGFYLFFTGAKLLTLLWTLLVAGFAAVGITAGAHRLWCHKAYKAKWQLRLILALFQTVAFQNHIYEWVRDHRVHHKFTDTDADPHNSKRGFFFAHMGWLLVRKHPDVISKGASVDMSDMESDPIVRWQRRLYILLMPICTFLLPAWVPCYFWNENSMYSWYATLFRYTISLHFTWLVNSAAHYYGTRPYDNTISATDNFRVALCAFGEGWHNYHHVFPWDYKSSELGDFKGNFSTAFIDFFAKVGWAYDLKTVPIELIEKRAARTGDGTRVKQITDHYEHEDAIWGWGDKDMHQEDIHYAQIINKAD